MFLNDFFNLVLVFKDIKPRYERTRAKDSFPTIRVFSFTTCVLPINVYYVYITHKSFETFNYKVFKEAIF